MFPYPSGEGLHIGHPEGYTASDIFSRYSRMNGYNVLHPMGWDAFGLPAENYAIQTKTHPRLVVEKNVKRFRKQFEMFGFDYDWSREVNTTDPEYYKWTQWIFLKMYEKNLSYEAIIPINWCPQCKTGLANEEVNEGKCDRCHTQVVKKEMKQWMLAITKYAERLLKDLEQLDWPEKIKTMQRNWIGRSVGSTVTFQVSGHRSQIAVFTTRPDTLFGATYMVLAPEHELVKKIAFKEHKKEVGAYVKAAKRKSDLERAELTKEKSGVFTGAHAVNPVSGQKIPIWISDYVLISYGTGAIMAVPAHDERDFEFAKTFNLPIIEVISPDGKKHKLKEAYTNEGILVNSGEFSGLYSEDAKMRITESLSKKKFAKKTIQYKLRDWVFSRQRYWGEPIPIIKCEQCGNVPLEEKDLPLKLPDVKNYEPTGTGESPLAAIKDWVNIECPKCKGKAKRETNTMPQWAGSCWYYLRYIDPKNKKALVDKKKEKYWMRVDLYQGGAEHAVLHLLYARFWHKFLYDSGVVSTKEPFAKLRNQGLILGPDGQKMSKSRGNIVNPDEVVAAYGADTLRMYEMFMGPLEDDKPWDTKGIVGIYRFLGRVWSLVHKSEIRNPKSETNSKSKNQNSKQNEEIERLRHKTIKKVTEDIEGSRFNTAISAMMEYSNGMQEQKHTSQKDLETLLLLLAPFAPHITEELWQETLKKKTSVHLESWPSYDSKLVAEDTFELIVQINGKMRAAVKLPVGADEEEATRSALSQPNVKSRITGQKPKRIVFVKNRLINIVV